ncbi:MAG: ATP-binding protein [Candidatus Delongbacteria bacterium]
MDVFLPSSFYKEVLEHMLEGCQIIGHDWRYIFINKTAERHNRRSAQEMIGQLYAEVWPGVETTPVYQIIRYCLEQRIQQNMENEFAFPDGGKGWFELRIYPVPEGVFIMSIDITERRHNEEILRATEAQLRQSQKLEAVGQLAGGVAHDFNNILTVILGYGYALQEELAENDLLREDVLQIVAAGERAAVLTRQLLAFSRKQVLQPEIVDLNEVIRNISKLLGRLLGEPVELSLALADEVVRIKVDPNQLEQVIVNLCVNARDAMPEGGLLTLETARIELDAGYTDTHVGVSPGKYIMLAVSDTGCGMDEATVQRIFEPFFTTKEVGRGTGLGLAMVYGIVNQSGGSIYVYSEVNRGTTFKLYFPLVHGHVAARRKAATRAPLGKGELVLLVEDDATLRQLCQRLLQDLSYRVVSADGPMRAYELVESERLRPDVLLTDVIMPFMSGPYLARRLQAVHRPLQVVYMSGYTDESILQHGVLDPSVPFLEKPFTLINLASKLREVLDGAQRTGGAA